MQKIFFSLALFALCASTASVPALAAAPAVEAPAVTAPAPQQQSTTPQEKQQPEASQKEEIIEYILANAKETKEAYFIPESSQVYDKEVEEVSKHVEEVKPVVQEVVTIVEEKPEEVSEEVIEEAPQVVEEVSEVETEVIEEVSKEEVEEIPVQEVKGPVQYVQTKIDLSELVQEIRLLRKSIEAIIPEPEEIEEEMKVPQEETVIINTAEFYGKPKSLKKIIKKDEADEREKFVEEKKQASSIGTDKKDDDDLPPAELRLLKKAGKGLGKFLLSMLKVLLKIFLVVFGIALLIFLLYGILAYYTDLEFLAGVDAFLDNLFGLNLLTRYLNLLGSILG